MKNHSIDLYLCLFIGGILCLTFAGHGTSVDENLIVQVCESLSTKGNLTCGKMFQALEGPDGNYYSRYGIGYILLVFPFYEIGAFLDWLFPLSNAFCSNPYMFAMLWSSILYTVLIGWVFYRLCLSFGCKQPLAVLLSLGLIFGSSFWPYSQTLYRLTAAGAILVCVLLFVFRYQKTQSKWNLVFLVFLTALGLNVREDLVIGLGWIGLYTLLRYRQVRGFGCAIAIFSGACLGSVLWGIHNYVRFGTFFIENYADLSFNYPLIISLPQLIAGVKRGLVFYSPLSLLLPLSFLAAKRHKKLDIWILCAGIISSYFLLYGKSNMWHGGICWGPRHMYFLLPFCIVPGIWFLSSPLALWKKVFFGAAFGWGILVNWPGVYCYQGRYQGYFECPSFFTSVLRPVGHPEYVVFEDFDLWWIRMIKLEPLSFWPILFLLLVVFTVFCGYRLWKSIL